MQSQRRARRGRERVVQMNAARTALVDAAGVVANFQRMVRIADATGIPVDPYIAERTGPVSKTLGLEAFRSAANTYAVG